MDHDRFPTTPDGSLPDPSEDDAPAPHEAAAREVEALRAMLGLPEDSPDARPSDAGSDGAPADDAPR